MKKLLYVLLFIPLALFGQENYSLIFDGVDDYVELGILSPFNQNESLSLEVKFKWNGVLDSEGQYILQFAQNGPGNVKIGVDNNGQLNAGVLQCNCESDYDSYLYYQIEPNDWYHVIYSYDTSNGDSKLWVNNNLVGEGNYPFNSYYNVNNSPSRIGNYHFNSYYFNGNIAYAQIVNDVLQPSLSSLPHENAIGCWDFNEGSGTTLVDLSGNGNDGMIYGATYSVDVPGQNYFDAFYSFDFESELGPEWSSISNTELQTIFYNNSYVLGNLADDEISLNLDNLPSFDSLTIIFDLYILDSWDGNHTGPNGPDYFSLYVNNEVLLNSTFSNVNDIAQCYPNDCNDSEIDNPMYSGAHLTSLIEYCSYGDASSLYKIEKTISNISNAVQILFDGSPTQSVCDESWAIDNVKIYLFAAPDCKNPDAINYNANATEENEQICIYSQEYVHGLWNEVDDGLIQYNEAVESLSSLQQALDTWNTTIDLSDGWNMFGYGCPGSIDMAEGLSNHTENIIITKDNNGNVYMPEFGFNGIGAFTPGFGYQIKLTEAIEGFSLCDWYVNDIPEDNIVSLQDSLQLINSQIGCADSLACNYEVNKLYDDGSCEFADEGYDCEGNITEYFVGMEVEGGVVFYVDETGQHGLVANINDIDGVYEEIGDNNGYLWGCFDGQSTDVPFNILSTEIGYGEYNTNEIIEYCQEENIAAKLADSFEDNTYTDWYLPSLGELSILCHVHSENSNKFNYDSRGFWTSSYNLSLYSPYFIDFYNSTSPGIYNLNCSEHWHPHNVIRGVIPIRSF